MFKALSRVGRVLFLCVLALLTWKPLAWWDHRLMTPHDAAHVRMLGTVGWALYRNERVDWALDWVDAVFDGEDHPMSHWTKEDYAVFLGQYMRLVQGIHGEKQGAVVARLG